MIVSKTGLYFGYEHGHYRQLETGIELRRKKISGNGQHINALMLGMNYQLKNNILGYDFGYYHKNGVAGFTYGFDIFAQTDFRQLQPAISPTIGFMFAGFHLQSGYKFTSHPVESIPVNTFFIRLRYTIVKNTDRKIRKGN